MDNKNNNKGVIILLVIIIIILGVLCVLFATDTITFNKNVNNDEQSSNTTKNNDVSNQVLTKDEALSISNEIIKKYYKTVPNTAYCGEIDLNDNIKNENNFSYNLSKSYSSKAEVEEFLKQFLSSSFTESQLNRKDSANNTYYIEKDNKLYCLSSSHSICSPNDNEISNEVLNVSSNKIDGKGSYITACLGSSVNNTYNFTIINENGNWVLDNYNEGQ